MPSFPSAASAAANALGPRSAPPAPGLPIQVPPVRRRQAPPPPRRLDLIPTPPASEDASTAPIRLRRPADPRVSVVVPAKNEAKNLVHVLPLLPESIDEVVLVDGNSTDDTVDVVRDERPDAVIVQQTGRGKGNALQLGFATSTGDIIVMLDADGSADPAEIPLFVAALTAGADFTKGSRRAVGGGSADITPLRHIGNIGLSWTVNLLFRTRYTDLCYGYNAFWRDCLPALSVDCDGFEVETLINIRAARSGLRIAEVPSYERERMHGQSNLNLVRDGLRVMRTILRERVRSAPRPLPSDNVVYPLSQPVARTRRPGPPSSSPGVPN